MKLPLDSTVRCRLTPYGQAVLAQRGRVLLAPPPVSAKGEVELQLWEVIEIFGGQNAAKALKGAALELLTTGGAQ